MTLGLPEYLESKISPEPNSGCWLWTASLSGSGYGQVKIPRTRKNEPAHRAVYRISRTEIPEELVGDHTCRVRCCVNPDHQDITTHQINILRGEGVSAKNFVKTHCPAGHEYDRQTVGGRRCRTCDSAADMRYYENNKERIDAKRRKGKL